MDFGWILDQVRSSHLMVNRAEPVEVVLAVAITLPALILPQSGLRVFQAFRSILSPLERRPRVAILLAGVLPVVLRLILLAWVPQPHPRTMEEHNYLLQADTYSHWRLSNPPHPFAAILESYQIVEWPRYVSCRPPVSSLFLFAGKAFFHSPFAGNLLGVGLASACFCWMLLGWLPRTWALLGSFIVICQFCLFGYWVNSYWEPAVTLVGACLLLGLVPRIRRAPRLIHALLFSIGIALLVGTRPYEGLVYSAFVSAWLLFMPSGRDQRSRCRTRVFILPATVGCLLVVAAQLYYDKETTGKAMRNPVEGDRDSRAKPIRIPAGSRSPIPEPSRSVIPG